MTNVDAIRVLQDAASYLIATTGIERASETKRAEDLIGDCVLALWNDPSTNRAEYWS